MFVKENPDRKKKKKKKIQTTSEKHLGIILDTRLSFEKHLQIVLCKINKTIGLIRKFAESVTQNSSDHIA